MPSERDEKLREVENWTAKAPSGRRYIRDGNALFCNEGAGGEHVRCHGCRDVPVDDVRFVAALFAPVEDARDRARLDWLEAQIRSGRGVEMWRDSGGTTLVTDNQNGQHRLRRGESLREAVDAARAASPKAATEGQ